MCCVTGEEGAEEGEGGGQNRGPGLKTRQHQKTGKEGEEEEGVGRGESWTRGRGERVEEDKGRKEGGTWQVVAVGAGGGV